MAVWFIAATLHAQTLIDMAAYIDEATAAQLGEQNTTALRDKITRMIIRNGMAAAEGLFAVTPTLTITDDGEIDTGMALLYVVRADLTLSVRNLVNNVVFASQTVPLQASGKDEKNCMRSLINRLNVSDVRFAKMFHDVQESIFDYYSRQMPRILATVNSYVAREEYEQAMAALAMIPESVDEYTTVADLKIQVYNKLLESEVRRAMAEADILVRQGDVDGALELCRTCNPLSPNYTEVTEFMRKLDEATVRTEVERLEAEQRKLDLQTQRARLQKEADAEAQELKTQYTETSSPEKKSIGAWLLGL